LSFYLIPALLLKREGIRPKLNDIDITGDIEIFKMNVFDSSDGEAGSKKTGIISFRNPLVHNSYKAKYRYESESYRIHIGRDPAVGIFSGA